MCEISEALRRYNGRRLAFLPSAAATLLPDCGFGAFLILETPWRREQQHQHFHFRLHSKMT